MARDVQHTFDKDSDTVTRTTTYRRVVKRCEEQTKSGVCDHTLDEHGYCGHEREHIDA